VARWGGWALLAILLGTQTGCLWTDGHAPNDWMARFQKQTISPDHALIEVALLERPLRDEYINQKIWEQVDELIVDFTRGGMLNENGFRLGQLVGPTPEDFQKLLLSKRSCANPQAMIFPAGKTTTIYLSQEMPQSTYEIVEGGLRTPVTLDQARYCLDVTAQFTSDGRTKLKFVPKVENGEMVLPFEAAPERSTWELRVEKASKKYPDLSWEVTLAPNQYLLMGARLDRKKTLGCSAFTQAPEPNVQRMLVIRSCRSVTAREANQNTVEEIIRVDRTAPLALQASIPASRAKTH
jgi:hypothetical protein